MRVEIIDGTLRDLSYLAANLRPEDQREIFCQLPEGITPAEIAALSMTGRAWCALLDGQPVAAFGIVPISVAVLSVWAWGTRRMWRAVPAITRMIRDELAPEWIRLGVHRVEARSIDGHDAAHRWLRQLGFSSVPCPRFGRDGEDFHLFSITDEEFERHVLRRRRRTQIHIAGGPGPAA